jgi:hypothetical protein
MQFTSGDNIIGYNQEWAKSHTEAEFIAQHKASHFVGDKDQDAKLSQQYKVLVAPPAPQKPQEKPAPILADASKPWTQQ